MARVKFIQPHKVKQGDGKGAAYAAGDVVDLPDTYAQKYISRGVAVAHSSAPPAVPPPPPPPLAASTDLTAAQLLAALEDGSEIGKNWMAWRAAAAKILGDDTPAKKDDIIAALKAKIAASAGGA